MARYADANNVGGGIENVRRKDGHPAPALRDGRARPCRDRTDDGARGGRHPRLASRGGAGQEAIFERNGHAAEWTDQPVGTPEDVAERLAPFLEIGYRHLIAGFPSPYDEESMTRLATEVRPILERA